VPELELGNDPNNWSSNDTNAIKDIIADCIPYTVSLLPRLLYVTK